MWSILELMFGSCHEFLLFIFLSTCGNLPLGVRGHSIFKLFYLSFTRFVSIYIYVKCLFQWYMFVNEIIFLSAIKFCALRTPGIVSDMRVSGNCRHVCLVPLSIREGERMARIPWLWHFSQAAVIRNGILEPHIASLLSSSPSTPL